MKYNLEIARDLADCFADSTFGSFTNRDTIRLWVLNKYTQAWDQNSIHLDLYKRWKMMARIEECRITGTGMMWVTESGMDCDCTQYSGHMHKCEATYRAFCKLYDDTNEWADGPFSLYPVTEAEKKEISPTSRDLAMEAHEDGHAHIVSAVRFDEDGAY